MLNFSQVLPACVFINLLDYNWLLRPATVYFQFLLKFVVFFTESAKQAFLEAMHEKLNKRKIGLGLRNHICRVFPYFMEVD